LNNPAPDALNFPFLPDLSRFTKEATVTVARNLPNGATSARSRNQFTGLGESRPQILKTGSVIGSSDNLSQQFCKKLNRYLNPPFFYQPGSRRTAFHRTVFSILLSAG
jgi:hypothetical protein